MFSICILLASIVLFFLVRKNVYLKKYLIKEAGKMKKYFSNQSNTIIFNQQYKINEKKY
jgi:hypothetical protein